jgi:hypothetical protein
MMLSNEVLPAPDAPNIAVIYPPGQIPLMLLRTVLLTVLGPNSFLIKNTIRFGILYSHLVG